LDALVDVPQVLLITIDVPRDYTAGNNQLIFDAASTYPNVEVLDWAGLVPACPGDPDGQDYYAALIAGSLDLS